MKKNRPKLRGISYIIRENVTNFGSVSVIPDEEGLPVWVGDWHRSDRQTDSSHLRTASGTLLPGTGGVGGSTVGKSQFKRLG